MLENLHVKNLALIDETEVEFSPGLNVLTGETGAGKSILLGSVQLALGGKYSAKYKSPSISKLPSMYASPKANEVLVIRFYRYFIFIDDSIWQLTCPLIFSPAFC